MECHFRPDDVSTLYNVDCAAVIYWLIFSSYNIFNKTIEQNSHFKNF